MVSGATLVGLVPRWEPAQAPFATDGGLELEEDGTCVRIKQIQLEQVRCRVYEVGSGPTDYRRIQANPPSTQGGSCPP